MTAGPAAPSARRALLFGMQSSGASLGALLAAQSPDTAAIIDLWNPEIAPRLHSVPVPVLVKATAGPVSLDEHLHSFEPDITVLFVRHPVDQISTLALETFRDYALPIEAKLEIVDHAWSDRASFDAIVQYEQVVSATDTVVATLTRAGWALPPDAALFPRSLDAVVAYSKSVSEWCSTYWREKWGTGRASPTLDLPLSSPDVRRTTEAWRLASRHCPSLLESYEGGELSRT